MEELPMRVDADDKIQDVVKSKSGDKSVPMTDVDGCRWLRKVIY